MENRIVCLMAIISFALTTSIHGQSVSYTTIHDDVSSSNFNVALNVFNADYSSKQSVSMGFGLCGSLAIKRIATAEFCWDKSYSPAFDMNYHQATAGIYGLSTINDPEHYNHYELGGMLHVMDNTSSKDRKVTLASGSSKKYSYESYIRIPAEVRSILGIRGGLLHYVFSVNDQEHGSITEAIPGIDGGGVVAEDGTEFGGAVSSFDSPFYNTMSVSNMRINGLYGGITYAEYCDIRIDASGYGTRTNRHYSRIYADVMFARTEIDDFMATDGKSYRLSGGQSIGFETRNLGFRIGGEVIKGSRNVAMMLRAEAGVKPGFETHKFYLSLGWGIAFRGKIAGLQ